jgi:hypothetical protein
VGPALLTSPGKGHAIASTEWHGRGLRAHVSIVSRPTSACLPVPMTELNWDNRPSRPEGIYPFIDGRLISGPI